MTEKTLGQYLRELRKANSFSQEFVASHLNIARQTYSHYETGRITPPIDIIYRLARLYGISVETFFERMLDYDSNKDFPLIQQSVWFHDTDDLERYLDYIKDPANSQKIRYLNRQERLLLYYYSNLDSRDQKDILAFMRIKKENRKDQ